VADDLPQHVLRAVAGLGRADRLAPASLLPRPAPAPAQPRLRPGPEPSARVRLRRAGDRRRVAPDEPRPAGRLPADPELADRGGRGRANDGGIPRGAAARGDRTILPSGR